MRNIKVPSFAVIWILCSLGHSNADVTPEFENVDNISQNCSNLTIGEDDSCDNVLFATMHRDLPFGSLFSPNKMIFARRLYDGIYLAGQPTPRQIKYAADSGFRSVLSIFDHDSQIGPDGQRMMSTAEEQELVENVAGMKFFKVLSKDDDWNSVDAVKRMTEIYPQLEVPALLHCYKSITVTFLTLLYYANQSVHNSTFEPRVDIRKFYNITRKHGLDFVELFNQTIPTVEAITGETLPSSATKPNLTLPRWFDYWESTPVYYNWYAAGQINAKELYRIKSTGFATVVNIRSGLTYNGQPSQESVELINIASDTPTYGTPTSPPRQSQEGLLSSIIDKSRPNEYVSNQSLVNYESENPDEFGDSVGQNEDIERAAFLSAGLSYEHLPLARSTDFPDYIEKNLGQLIEISKRGPVLVHCTRARRASYVSTLAAAVQYDLTLDWALKRLKELGFGISAENNPAIYNVYKKYLENNSRVEL